MGIRLVGVVAVSVVVAGAVALQGTAGTVLLQVAAQADSATPIAVQEEAEMTDLQTRVADLSTRVAELGGADAEALLGRLGGSRSGFDEVYGAPVAFLGNGVVQYDVPDVGRLTVTFVDDVAEELTVVSPRPAALPLDEPNQADWTPERADEIAETFAPSDAEFEAGPADPDGSTGSSDALAEELAVTNEEGCAASGARSFTVRTTTPDEEQVSEVSLALAEGAETLAPAEPQRSGRANRGASAVANTSLGSVAAVNGLRLQAFDVAEGASGTRQPALGQSFVAVEVAIENEGRRPVRFGLTDFILVDSSGLEVTAVCGGVEPEVGEVQIGRGEAAEGWVTFQVPEGFEPARFVVLAPGAQVGFEF